MRWLPFAAAFFAFFAVIPGCGNSNVSVDHALQSPILRAVTINPLSFGFEGGKVTMTANVQSTQQIEAVTVDVTQVQPEGSYTRLYVLESTGDGNYRGEIPLPSNTDASGETIVYNLAVTAKDAAGVSSETIHVRTHVAAPAVPPSPA